MEVNKVTVTRDGTGSPPVFVLMAEPQGPGVHPVSRCTYEDLGETVAGFFSLPLRDAELASGPRLPVASDATPKSDTVFNETRRPPRLKAAKG